MFSGLRNSGRNGHDFNLQHHFDSVLPPTAGVISNIKEAKLTGFKGEG
jgi:hypothetical protein